MSKNRKFRPEIEAMKVGDEIEFPAEKVTSIRALASDMGLVHNRKYATSSDCERRVVVVKRLS